MRMYMSKNRYDKIINLCFLDACTATSRNYNFPISHNIFLHSHLPLQIENIIAHFESQFIKKYKLNFNCIKTFWRIFAFSRKTEPKCRFMFVYWKCRLEPKYDIFIEINRKEEFKVLPFKRV